MPQSHTKRVDATAGGIRLTTALQLLAFLACPSDKTMTDWHNLSRRRDVSVQRIVRWYQVAKEAIGRYDYTASHNELWDLKNFLHSWFLHKHSVLKDALNREEILQAMHDE